MNTTHEVGKCRIDLQDEIETVLIFHRRVQHSIPYHTSTNKLEKIFDKRSKRSPLQRDADLAVLFLFSLLKMTSSHRIVW